MGHLDYIVRVAPTKDKNYSYDKYKDAIDPDPGAFSAAGKGLELNTGSFRYGLRHSLIPVPMFCAAIMSWAVRSSP